MKNIQKGTCTTYFIRSAKLVSYFKRCLVLALNKANNYKLNSWGQGVLTLAALRFAQIRYSMLNTSENAFANFSVPDEPSYRLDTCRDRQTDAGSSLSFTGCQVWKHWRSRACMSCSPDAYVLWMEVNQWVMMMFTYSLLS